MTVKFNKIKWTEEDISAVEEMRGVSLRCEDSIECYKGLWKAWFYSLSVALCYKKPQGDLLQDKHFAENAFFERDSWQHRQLVYILDMIDVDPDWFNSKIDVIGNNPNKIKYFIKRHFLDMDKRSYFGKNAVDMTMV